MDQIIFKYFWVAAIVVTFINALILRSRSAPYIRQNPELKEGYNKLFKGFIIYGNIPWFIMGIGNLTTITSSVFQYFFPGLLNPMVLIFHASIVSLWILSVRWIYFQGGAEMLESHPGFLRTNPSAKMIKVLFPIMLLGGVAGMVGMWVMSFQHMPQFPH